MKVSWSIIASIFLGVILASSLGILLGLRMAGFRPEEPGSAPIPAPSNDSEPAPFADLETAIAAEGWDPNWKVYRRPDLPGPYRVVGFTFSIGASPLYHAIVSHTDPHGRFITPIELVGNPEFAQMAVHLETADGRITGVILKH